MKAVSQSVDCETLVYTCKINQALCVHEHSLVSTRAQSILTLASSQLQCFPRWFVRLKNDTLLKI